MRDPETAVAVLANIGPVSARWLNEINVFTLADLQEIGVVEAYSLIRARHERASLNLLYGLQAALLGISWKDIAPEMKTELQADVADFKFTSD